MKAKLILGLFAACSMAGAMTGCSSDEPAGGQDNKTEKSVYLRVAISNVNGGSRAENTAGNFMDATPEECAINSLQFRFFDAAGNPIKSSNETDYTFVDATTPEQGAPSVDKIKEAVVEVTLDQGVNLPSYVLVFANNDDWNGVNDQTPMNGYRNVERTSYKNGNYFIMNNSVYYGADPVSGQANVKISGTPITAGQLFSTREEAEAAKDGQVVDIYIERRAARIDVKVADAIDDYTVTNGTGDSYTLSFTPEAWTITADAPNMYAIKRFATEAAADGVIPSMTEVQTYLTTWTTWNDATLHRSYWACSPGFYATEFPRVSDNIVDIANAEGSTITNNGAGVEVAPYALKYYSFNQVNGANGSGITAGAADAVTRYALENTMGKDAFASLNPNAAAPSVLLTGKYTVKNAAGTALPANTSFAIWNNRLYFMGTVPADANTGAKTILDAMLATQEIVATYDAANDKYDYLRTARAGLAVQHPAAKVREGNVISEERMTLQLTTMPQDGKMLYYKPVGSDHWTPINTEADLTFVNQQLAGQLSYAHAYTEGAAYFGIPVKHLRASEVANSGAFVKDAATGKETVDWTKVLPGDFGLVRNHVYTINVTKITGLGDGVLDLDYPIVTPTKTNNYYIKYSLKVLNWRIVPKQDVVL